MTRPMIEMYICKLRRKFIQRAQIRYMSYKSNGNTKSQYDLDTHRRLTAQLGFIFQFGECNQFSVSKPLAIAK